jgi:hypothetical protein
MNVSENIITDLLPLFYSGDCSGDTKNLVEEYMKKNPDFWRKSQAWSKTALPGSVPKRQGANDEMKALKKTKWLLRLRAFLLAFAILNTLNPFSFSCTQGKMYWLITQSPSTAIAYGITAIFFWVAYIVVRRATNDA